MPAIALSLSLLFSFVLIARDCIRRKSVSAAVWVPTILLMILCSRPASLWISGRNAKLGIQMANDLAPSIIDQVFYLSVLGLSFLISTIRGYQWKKLFVANLALMLFYSYFACSIMWSSDPAGSTKRLIKDFGLLAVAGILFTEKKPLEAIRAIYVRTAFLLLPLSVVFIRYFPGLGRTYTAVGLLTVTGATTQKNSLGETTLLYTLFIVWDYLETPRPPRKNRFMAVPWHLIVLMILGGYLLLTSQSKTALLCTLTGTFLLVRSGRLLSKSIGYAAMIGAMCLPFIVLFSQKLGFLIAPLVEALGRNMTFTGRTNIWDNITLDTVNPLIGAGYWNFWGGPLGYKFNLSVNMIIPNAHNGYVDLYLDGGLIGLCILFFLLFSTGQRIINRIGIGKDGNHYQRMKLAVLVALIVYNLGESTYARIGPIWFSALLMMVDYPILDRVTATAKNQVKAIAQSGFGRYYTPVGKWSIAREKAGSKWSQHKARFLAQSSLPADEMGRE